MSQKTRPARTARSGKPAPRAPAAAGQHDARAKLAQAARERSEQRYVLRLYVTGATASSGHAIERARAICEEHLRDRYDLEVIDIYQLPALAKGEQIVATPTLVKALPEPLCRYTGDLADVDRGLFGLDLRGRPRA